MGGRWNWDTEKMSLKKSAREREQGIKRAKPKSGVCKAQSLGCNVMIAMD